MSTKNPRGWLEFDSTTGPSTDPEQGCTISRLQSVLEPPAQRGGYDPDHPKNLPGLLQHEAHL